MIEPSHNSVDGLDGRGFGQRRPPQHHDRQAHGTCRGDLAVGGIAAAVHPGNIALFGTPSANFAAAAKFAAVAVAAGVASKALGGGSERSRGERDRSDRGGDNRRGGPNVVVQVDGSIFGTDPNELARSIQTLLTKAQADGA